MRRSVSLATCLSLLGVLAASMLAGAPVYGRNIAGGGAALSARQILTRSAKATAAVETMYTKGAAKGDLVPSDW